MVNKLLQISQCIRYRGRVLGKIGKKNEFRPNCLITSAATIGDNNYFGDRVMISNAVIGNYCSFAPDVKIAQSQHSIDYITTFQKISKHNINYSLLQEKTVIGSDVWIGANAIVMQGVKIGNGAVIGANAVVTKDVSPYSIVAGIPAKLIRYRFDDAVISRIEESRWWMLPYGEACIQIERLYKELFEKREG